MRYQTFDESDRGSSDSQGKFTALRMDRSVFKDARVLDLGCNEGYFCGKALEYGAKRVVGIDQSPDLIASAKTRFPAAEFLYQSWDHGWPAGRWDVVLMLSAFHYVESPDALLCRIRNSLSDKGVFILECGVVGMDGPGWQRVTRGDGSTVGYTSSRGLRQLLNRNGLTCRDLGESVKQQGDPITRRVIHCGLKRRTIVLVAGNSMDGKTSLCEEMGLPYFSVDAFSRRSIWFDRAKWTKETQGPNLSPFYEKMSGREDFLESLFLSLPNDPVVVVDIIEPLASQFSQYIKDRTSDIVWELKKSA